MTQPDPNANDSQNPEPDSSTQRWLEEVEEQEWRKWEELEQEIEEQERLEQERRKWEELERQEQEQERLELKRLELERLEQEIEEQERERAAWNQKGDSDRFEGYHVREPDGTWRPRGNEGPVGNRGRDPNGQGDSDRFEGYHVREPDGTWRRGGNEGHVWGPGRVLGSGEPSPDPAQGGNTPEQPTLEDRRKAAAEAAERRRDAERSERTGNSQGQGR
jgi:hypothetical protein